MSDTKRIFEKHITINTTVEKLIAFHEDPAALGRLTPPPIFVQVREDNRTSLTNGDLKFTLWFGPIPLKWHVQHESGPTETSFADRMLSGPMAHWYHEHIFTETPDGARLTDRVTIQHKSGWQGLLTRLMFDGLPLRILFFYRHLRTRLALKS